MSVNYQTIRQPVSVESVNAASNTTDRDIRCHHCHQFFDIAKLRGDQFKYATMPNTLTDLKDHNSVDFQCPKCGVWNLVSDNL